MAGNLPFGLAPSGELTAYQPTLRERVSDWLRQSLFTDDRAGQEKANYLTNWGETMIPPFGFATSMYDAGNQAGRGNYLGAGLTAGAAFIPGPEGKAAEKAGIRAFHASPHSFDKFEWSPRTRGTGEGAQAYGDGLYFAEHEPVATGYRYALAPGMGTDNLKAAGLDDKTLSHLPQFTKSAVDPEIALRDWLGWTGKRETPEIRDAFMKDWAAKNDGHMYEVNIDADPNAFLDWDKPLSEQSEKVKDAAYKAMTEIGLGPTIANYIINNKTGSDLMNTLARGSYQPNKLMPDGAQSARASNGLFSAGIPGIKYLDAGSRGAGDGTRNYVVFDDKLISIVRKYGIAGASAYLGYDIMQNVTPAQADELKKIEGK